MASAAYGILSECNISFSAPLVWYMTKQLLLANNVINDQVSCATFVHGGINFKVAVWSAYGICRYGNAESKLKTWGKSDDIL